MKELTNEEKLKKYFDSNSEYEMAQYEEGLKMLKQVTKVKHIATLVLNEYWYGIKKLDRKDVCEKDFFNLLLDIATQVTSGRSESNIRDHITNVVTDEKYEWKKRRDAVLKGNPAPGTVVINLQITLKEEQAQKFLEILGQSTLEAIQKSISHFDGEAANTDIVYEVAGSPEKVILIMQQMSEKYGREFEGKVRYISKKHRIDRKNLTLIQALNLAEREIKA